MENNFEDAVKKLVHESVKAEVKNIIDSQKEILNMEEAAALLGLSKSYLYKKTYRGEIPFYRPLGKVIYFERSVLLNWIRSHPAVTPEGVAAAANHYTESTPLKARL